MPDGRTHTSVTLLTTAYVGAFLTDRVVNMGYPVHSLLAMAGCLSGALITPDLDVDAGNIGFYIIRRRAGSLPAFLWRVYWWPYSRLIPHRSWVSHLPILSTIVRLAYLFWWLLLIPGVTQYWNYGLWFAIGLMVVDLNHAFLDFIHPDKENYR